MSRLVLFVDDGGVMSDNRLRGPQWQRLVSEFFAPRLGGAKEAWAEANRITITEMLDYAAWKARMAEASNYESFDYKYQLDWLARMCEIVGIACPDADTTVDMAREATRWIIPQVRAAFPGVVDTIELLHKQGYKLYTASGESSSDLEGYLRSMGVLDCFSRLYGPDLVEAFKSGPAFYERIFADCGVEPDRALVIDDSPAAIGWAAEVGAHTALVGGSEANHMLGSGGTREPEWTIESLAGLPALLSRDIESNFG